MLRRTPTTLTLGSSDLRLHKTLSKEVVIHPQEVQSPTDSKPRRRIPVYERIARSSQ
jgi:hypothetical protein